MTTMTQGAIDAGLGEAQLRSDGHDYLYSDQPTLNGAILPQQFDSRDTLDGGAGDDWMEGGQRDDTLFGGTGNDTLFGDGAGHNEAATFEGRDWIDGSQGDDVVSGGGNNDSPSPCNGSTNRTVGLLRKLGVE